MVRMERRVIRVTRVKRAREESQATEVKTARQDLKTIKEPQGMQGKTVLMDYLEKQERMEGPVILVYKVFKENQEYSMKL